MPCKYRPLTDEVTRSALLKFHRENPFYQGILKKWANKIWLCLVFFLSFSFLRTNVTGVSRAHRADSKIGTAADWAGWICFCRKTTQEITENWEKECFFAGWMLNDLVSFTKMGRKAWSGVDRRVLRLLSHHFGASCCEHWSFLAQENFVVRPMDFVSKACVSLFGLQSKLCLSLMSQPLILQVNLF